MADRIRCCVPFCRRTRGDRKNDPIVPGMEWICSDHVKMVDRKLRRLRSAIWRRAERLKLGKDYQSGWVHLRITRAINTDWLIWERMKRQAIERAAGL